MSEVEVNENFKDAMAQWVDLKKRLAAAKEDLKVLNKQEKNLRLFIQEYMVDHKIDACNTKDAKVAVKTRNKKSPFTKDLVKRGLLKYFNGNEERANYVFELILECADVTEASSVSLSLKK